MNGRRPEVILPPEIPGRCIRCGREVTSKTAEVFYSVNHRHMVMLCREKCFQYNGTQVDAGSYWITLYGQN